MSEPNRPKVCCDMILEKNGQILMSKRKNIAGEGTWQLVGGHMELGETSMECAKRELMEETGITPKKIKLLCIINDLPNLQPNQYIRFVYYISQYSGEIVNKEPNRSEGWMWIDKNNLPEPIFWGHVKTLKYFLNPSRKLVVEE